MSVLFECTCVVFIWELSSLFSQLELKFGHYHHLNEPPSLGPNRVGRKRHQMKIHSPKNRLLVSFRRGQSGGTTSDRHRPRARRRTWRFTTHARTHAGNTLQPTASSRLRTGLFRGHRTVSRAPAGIGRTFDQSKRTRASSLARTPTLSATLWAVMAATGVATPRVAPARLLPPWLR